MTDKENQLSRIKYQLRQKKESGKKEVIWKLNVSQKEYIEDSLNHKVIPWIYEINTTSFKNFQTNSGSILFQIHMARKKGQKRIYRKLKKHEKKVLDQSGIKYRAFKYKIVLQ